MNILEEARTLLLANGYLVSRALGDTFDFEDETLIGFVSAGPIKQIEQSWSARQDQFIRDRAPDLRKSAIKSWNLYSVFLSSDAGDADARKIVAAIEEDFRATRKIVGVGITTLADVTHALYPLIPIQNVIGITADDLRHKFSGRLSTLPTEALHLLLRADPDDRSLVREFLEAHENKSA